MRRKILFICTLIFVILLTACQNIGTIRNIYIDENNNVKEDIYVYLPKDLSNDDIISLLKENNFKETGMKIIEGKEYNEFINEDIKSNKEDDIEFNLNDNLFGFFNANEYYEYGKHVSGYMNISTEKDAEFSHIVVKTAKPIVKTNGTIQEDGSVLFDLFDFKESRKFISFNKNISDGKSITFMNVRNGKTYNNAVNCKISSNGIITDITVNGCTLKGNRFYTDISGTYAIIVKLASGVSNKITFTVKTNKKFSFKQNTITKTISDKKTFINKVSNNFGPITYSCNNNKVATVNDSGEIKITGIGSTKIYAKCRLGTTYMILNVIPNKATISKIVKRSTNSIQVNIKKDKTATGYQIIYSKDPKFKKGNKVLTVKNNTKTVNIIINLSKKSKYYIKVRSYKTVNKKNYYGNWSNIKSIKL